MVAYARFSAAQLPKSVGVDGADGRRRSDGRAGHLCHGPYLTLGPGRYTAGFYISREPGADEGEIQLEVCCEHGARMLASRTEAVRDLFASIAGLIPLDFELDAIRPACEMRLFVGAGAHVELAEALLFRRDVKAWGYR